VCFIVFAIYDMPNLEALEEKKNVEKRGNFLRWFTVKNPVTCI